MVSGRCKRRIGLSQPEAFKGPGCGVIHCRAVSQQTFLKRFGIFAQVMGQTGQPPLCRCAERTGEGGAPG